MAKSLRASSHLNAKSIKRRGVFQKAVDAREQRISEKLKEDLLKQKLEDLKKKEEQGIEMEVDEKKPSDEAAKKKVSTSGWRDGRHHVYKKAKLMKQSKKKTSFTKF
ncbi:YBL028C [Saccharomyces arboricola H-6]|uniref:YBL028C n=1 Tax=Saccharomyces arboricola (strain H-6 / AS 2.3317 / CBS 10644) TaxID=1160507 RepID=J8QAQ3_SACAR|nr:YBL028C [Saccharomyces arboricola H-6]